MKSIALLITGLFVAINLLSPALVFAKDPLQDVCGRLTQAQKDESSACANSSGDPIAGGDGIIARIVSFLSWAIGVTSVIIVIYGSIKYVTSGGDSNKVSTAKETILYALIGLVVAVLARAIISFAISRTN